MEIVLTSDVPHYFKCTQCGLCCKGSVELTEKEYEKIVEHARRLGLRVPIEIRDYVFQTKIIMRPVEDEKGERWCIFLTKNDNRRVCSIYPDRPSFCRLYPLYIGVSKDLDKVYVDVVHCPEVRHVPDGEREPLDVSNVSKIVHEIISENPAVLNIVPDLDRHCIVLDLGDRVAACKLYHKYMIECTMFRRILSYVRPDVTWLELMKILLSVQSKLRDLSSSFMFRNELPTLNELEKQVESAVQEGVEDVSKINDGEVIQQARLILQDVGVRIDESLYYVYDVVNLKSKLFRLDDSDFRTCIGDMYMYVRELFHRFPVFHQLHFLPLEMVLTHGYLPLVVMTMLYTCSLKSQDVWCRMANVDMSALPYVFKYVSTLVRLTYASRLREQWQALPEG